MGDGIEGIFLKSGNGIQVCKAVDISVVGEV